MNARANKYRELHAIPASWGTAVNVQSMVFGNRGETSATGVAFTRDPSTGENELYGEFLINAQGEDVVAGIRTPQDITETARVAANSTKPSMERAMPEAYARALRIYGILEKPLPRHAGHRVHDRGRQALHAADPQRQAHRQGGAAHRGRLASEGLITEDEAVLRVDPAALDQLLHPTFDPKAERKIIATGLPASPGARRARSCSARTRRRAPRRGGKVILVRVETEPEDIHGMHVAEGILTTRGGMTSHAAVVARGMGKPCVSGAGLDQVDYAAQTLRSPA